MNKRRAALYIIIFLLVLYSAISISRGLNLSDRILPATATATPTATMTHEPLTPADLNDG